MTATSARPEVNFASLKPGTQVGDFGHRCCCWDLCSVTDSWQVLAGGRSRAALVASMAAPHCFKHTIKILPRHFLPVPAPLQYTVSVVGRRQDGTNTPPSNALNFVTPALR